MLVSDTSSLRSHMLVCVSVIISCAWSPNFWLQFGSIQIFEPLTSHMAIQHAIARPLDHRAPQLHTLSAQLDCNCNVHCSNRSL